MQHRRNIYLKPLALVMSLVILIVLMALPAGAYSVYHGVFYGSGRSYWSGYPAPSPAPTPPPAPTPTPTPQPPPTPVPGPTPSLTAEEARLFDLVNQARAQAGRPPLAINYTLVKLARLKSQDMITNHYYSHVSPTYGTARDMVRAAGLSSRYVGENLAAAPDVETAHRLLMSSPAHRANLLLAMWDEIGVGVVHGGSSGAMITEIFLDR